MIGVRLERVLCLSAQTPCEDEGCNHLTGLCDSGDEERIKTLMKNNNIISFNGNSLKLLIVLEFQQSLPQNQTGSKAEIMRINR